MKRTVILGAPIVAAIALAGYIYGAVTHGPNSGALAAQIQAPTSQSNTGSGVQIIVGQPQSLAHSPSQGMTQMQPQRTSTGSAANSGAVSSQTVTTTQNQLSSLLSSLQSLIGKDGKVPEHK